MFSIGGRNENERKMVWTKVYEAEEGKKIF